MTVCVRPPPETVTVPLRAVVAVLAVAETVSVPLLVPLAGVTVIHVWLSVAVQLTLEVTETVELPAPEATESAVGETVSVLVCVAPACVTVTVCVNPSLMGGNGSGELPGPNCPAGFRKAENFIAGTEPKKTDADFYTSCGINLRAPFADWQRDYNTWAAEAVAGRHSYGRFAWQICGFAPKPSASPSPSPGATGRPSPTPPPPKPTKRP